MTEEEPEETDREDERGRPTAASIVAELWREREDARSAATPLPAAGDPPRSPGERERGGAAGKGGRGAVAVVGVALLLGAGVGVFVAGAGLGRSNFATKADGVCRSTSGAGAAMAKPSTYPELATAASTVTAVTGTQLTGLR